MRLLRARSRGGFALTNFEGDTLPPYAILSHTWGSDNEELTFEDLENGTGKRKDGYQKLTFCSKQAKKDGLRYFWVDTCCIDKRSSSELQESINSMFKWYRGATVCYVYLSDVPSTGLRGKSEPFEKSRWFTRGWTLQELLAPTSVQFFSEEGDLLGDKISLAQKIVRITGIPAEALQGGNISAYSVEQRMSWSKGRNTKREEDSAYALLGIFDVHMPLIYGEGKEKALKRLQKEVRESKEGGSDVQLQDRTLEKVRNWLSAPDPSTNYHKADKQRQADTGSWLIESKQFARWKTKEASRLWLYGIPGCGKTVLSSTIIQHLRQHCRKNASLATLYFFFDFNDPQKQDAELMLRSLLRQLLNMKAKVPTSMYALFESCRNGHSQPTLHEVLEVVQQTLLDFSHVYLVLDALDECAQRPGLLQLLKLIAEWKLPGLHLLLTSRKEWDIETSLGTYIAEENTVCLQSKVVDGDIQRYVRQRLSDDINLAKWSKDAEIKQEIEIALMRGALGM